MTVNITDPKSYFRHSVPTGELPPPPPRACFGRNDLIEKIVGLAEEFEPVALIGAGGIGKTSIALSALHSDRLKERFGDNRRFIRCDEFSASRAHFLSRLSEVIGAGVENPKSLTPLRPLLTSRDIFIILDNVESILDPQGADAQAIYGVVDELCQIKTVSLCITSRIITVPRHCSRPEIPTLTLESACNIFYRIYPGSGQSDIINDLLRRLDFHALSITLLATTASYHAWDHDRLATEWDTHRAQVLQTDYNESLAATIELSLSSPTFLNLGPDARNLLGVVAFFPQGVDEKNLDWLFPTIPDRKNIFNRFCVLSLTYKSNGFITMLAPLRDYLNPRDPRSSPLLCATKDRYFTRLSVTVEPDKPGFREALWIKTEDVNVEHLLNAFASADVNSGDIWNTCIHFLQHLRWHNPRETTLLSKIEDLPDDHPSKISCLLEVSQLLEFVDHRAERQRLLALTLTLARKRGGGAQVAQTLEELCDANRWVRLYEEGIRQAEEGQEIYKQLGDTIGRARCLHRLGHLLSDDGQLDPAEDTVSRAIDLMPEEGNEYLLCLFRRTLGEIYMKKGKKEKAIHNFKVALEIAFPFGWPYLLFWTHLSLGMLFVIENECDNAMAHIEQAKPYAAENRFRLGRIIEQQALICFQEHRFEDAKSEILSALEIFENLGEEMDAERCGNILRATEEAMKEPVRQSSIVSSL